MPSILRGLPAVAWLCGKNFTINGKSYKVGDEVPEVNEFPRLEVLVRTRHVIPVVESTEDLPFQFRHVVMTRERAIQKLESGHPGGQASDIPVSTAVRTLEVTEPKDEEQESNPQPEVEGGFDPEDHNIDEVLEYVGEDSTKATQVYVAEEQGKNRPTLLKQLEDIINKEESDG